MRKTTVQKGIDLDTFLSFNPAEFKYLSLEKFETMLNGFFITQDKGPALQNLLDGLIEVEEYEKCEFLQNFIDENIIQ